MTKQEEIREGIKPYLRAVAPFVCPKCKHPLGKDILDEQAVAHIMEYLHSQGVAIRVDRKLPKNPYLKDADYLPTVIDIQGTTNLMHNAYKSAQEDMAGYVAVEPLIKED